MRVFTGIQPSGDLHIGNYFGSIKQMVDAQKEADTFAFIANYHAMSSGNGGKKLADLTMQTATDFFITRNKSREFNILGTVRCQRSS
jgi:tryptophanyl-tRNA synthetase